MSPVLPSPAAATATATLDEQALAELRALDPSGRNRLLERVVGAFESSTDKLLPQITDALAREDHAAIRHVAHTLKSSSASVGAKDLSRACAELEARLRESRFDGLAPAVAGIVAQVGAVRQALRRLVEVPS